MDALSISISVPNVLQIGPELAEIRFLCILQRCAMLNFQKVTFWTFGDTYCPYLQAYQIWCKLITNWPRYALLCIFQYGGRRHLEFPNSAILDPPFTLVFIIYITTPNLMQIYHELAEIHPIVYFPRWQLPKSWTSKKWNFGSPVTLVLLVLISIPNLVQIDQELAEIHPLVHFTRWRPPTSWIWSAVFWLRCHSRCPYLSAYQIWCKLIEKCPRYGLLCILQYGGCRHLKFPKSDFWTPVDTYIVHIY